jgi:hypothetical protein
MIIPEFTKPEHLGDPYLGAWYVDDTFTQEEADAVINEVEVSGKVEPIWDIPETSVTQKFRRLTIDMQKEHDFPHLELLGKKLADYAVSQAGVMFPKLHEFQIDEAAVQIYPADTGLALGWHKDHKDDLYMVISAVLAGSGTLSFTEKTPYKDTAEKDIIANIHTRALGAAFFRANGLYTRQDESDIRVAHAVTAIDTKEDRFTIQYRMGVNAGTYGNVHVNAIKL